MLLGIFAGW
jgi:hypothetical protein